MPAGVLFIFTAALGTDRNRIGVASRCGSRRRWSSSPCCERCTAAAPSRGWAAGAEPSVRRCPPRRCARWSPRSAPASSDRCCRVPGPTHCSRPARRRATSPRCSTRSSTSARGSSTASNTEMFTVNSSVGRYWRVTGLSEFRRQLVGPARSSTLESTDGRSERHSARLAASCSSRCASRKFGGELVPDGVPPDPHAPSPTCCGCRAPTRSSSTTARSTRATCSRSPPTCTYRRPTCCAPATVSSPPEQRVPRAARRRARRGHRTGLRGHRRRDHSRTTRRSRCRTGSATSSPTTSTCRAGTATTPSSASCASAAATASSSPARSGSWLAPSGCPVVSRWASPRAS